MRYLIYATAIICLICTTGCSNGKNKNKEKIVNEMSNLKVRIGLLESLTAEGMAQLDPQNYSANKVELIKCKNKFDSLEMELKKY